VTNQAAPTLENLRVVDLSRAVSGPYVGRILADLGADVLKIESPERDVAEEFGRRQGAHSGLYTQMNAGKRTLPLDLTTPADLATARALLGRADVAIENFRPGVMDRMGVGYAATSAANPGLVLLSISGFGASGPESGRRAFAPVIHAESGLLLRNRTGSGPAGDLPLAMADTIAALHGTVAVLAALRRRERTGRGQHIDMSMLEAVVASDDHVHHAIEEDPQTMPSRGLVWSAPGGPILLALEMGATWKRLSRTFGLTDAAEGPFDTLEAKFAARARIVAGWIAAFPTRHELLSALDQARIGWADPRRSGELMRQPSLAARPPYDEIDDGEGGRRRVVRMPYHFSDAPDARVGELRPCDEASLADLLERWSVGA
jgi:CoA:oxalate CoA-transferase